MFPGVEYDFTPNTVVASLDNYVHTQWTGSDNNPNNNAGQGKAGTDRSNIALLKELVSYFYFFSRLVPSTKNT